MPKKPASRGGKSQQAGAGRGKPARAVRPEVVVIGSGAVGAACASALARGGERVRVLSHPGRSTTAMSGGHLLLQSKRPGPKLDAARRGLELIAEFALGQENDLRFRQTGSLILAVTDEEIAALRQHVDALTEAGVPVEWLDHAAACALESGLAPEVLAASYCPLDAQIDPAALAGAWLQDALAHGASLTSGAAVEGFVTTSGRVVGVVAGGREFAASAVVIAAGPWSADVAALAGVSLDLRPRRGLLLRSASERPLAARPLLSASYLAAKLEAEQSTVSFSFQQHPDGECVLGGSREFAGFEAEEPPEAAAAIIACGARYLPGVAALQWARHDLGFRPWTSTGLPFVGKCAVPGVYLACGHEGDGITLAADTAQQIAGLIGGVD